MVTIRSLNHDDVDHLLSLIYELAVYQGLEDRYAPDPDRLRLQLGIGNPRISGFLALAGTSAVGYAIYRLDDYSTFQTRWQSLLLEDWYIQPPYRNQGIGQRLLSRIFAAARHESVDRVKLSVHCDNAVAKELYDHLGAELPPPSDWEERVFDLRQTWKWE